MQFYQGLFFIFTCYFEDYKLKQYKKILYSNFTIKEWKSEIKLKNFAIWLLYCSNSKWIDTKNSRDMPEYFNSNIELNSIPYI
jgi:hypothetical protein